jgi:hypothetical protein
MDETQVPTVADILAITLEQYAELAWQNMGLRPNAFSQKLETHLPEAKLAIDAASALADLLIPRLDEEDRRQIQRLIADLRLNYVQRASAEAA